MEVELKLLIDPSDVSKLLKDPLLKPATKAHSQRVSLENIYFDTPDHELQAARIGLRLRCAGKQWLQTIKGGGQVIGGLHSRQELEYPVSGRALDFAPAADSPWADWFDEERITRLKPVFATNFQRTVRVLRPTDEVEIELALDQGEIVVTDKTEPICEIELELKAGPVSALFDIALAIASRYNIHIENASKAERGYRLAYGEQITAPQKWTSPTVAADTPLTDAVSTLAHSLLDSFQRNETGFLRRPDESEYLHQMRVTLRRLRVLLSAFRPHLPDPDKVSFLMTELRWLGTVLGNARDWDVLLGETLPPLFEQIGPHTARSRLHARLVARGYAAHDEARLTLSSRRYQLLLLEWGRYFATLTNQETLIHFDEALGPVLKKYAKRLQATLSKAAEDGLARHQSRIAGKKMRYLGEFGQMAYGGKRYEKFAEWLAQLQSQFGHSNDDRVANGLLADIVNHVRKTDEAELIGLLRGWLMARQVGQITLSQDLPRTYW
ncbi:CYTH and CHAD domain-containing protein [Chitinivorax sp. B]|uniref:CYTH and CHAD domain-containing protein n=1 Tax=Chitinivorax sp. B TaxID=2502235 RepID=UPI0010F9E595|nr:CYTH and CHAD domain-containing protein [Chitinivorax sp. B]